jgi:asparagine synthase (glutamine-hydrolysing)
MCGFVVSVSENKAQEPVHQFKNRLSKLEHRGPDSSKVLDLQYSNLNILLGFNRLTITDINDRSMQPMSSSCNQYHLVFNGEIYNFKEIKNQVLGEFSNEFRTDGDAEVILIGYIREGQEFFKRLDGSFSIVIIDFVEKLVVCVRDRFSDKPLFYRVEEKKLIVASEKKAILANSRSKGDFDEKRLAQSIIGVLPHGSNGTIIENIKQVRGGQVLTYNLVDSAIACEQYFELPQFETEFNISADLASEQLRKLISNSLIDQVPSELPFGLALSSGIDSTLLLQEIYKNGLNLSNWKGCLTVSFPEYPQYDEFNSARVIGQAFKCEVWEVKPDINDLVSQLDLIIAQHEDVLPGLSVLLEWEVMRHAKSLGFKVMLDGQGADELFCGYSYYYQYFQRMNTLGVFRYIRNDLVFMRQIKQQGFLSTIVDPDFMSTWKHFREPWITFYRRNIQFGSLPSNLQIGDRNSMSQGIELRHPFLDNQLLEFIFKLSKEHFWQEDQGKKILRSINSISQKKSEPSKFKKGYEAPLDAWFQQRILMNWIEEKLNQGNVVFHPLLHKLDIRELMASKSHANMTLLFRWATAMQLLSKGLV